MGGKLHVKKPTWNEYFSCESSHPRPNRDTVRKMEKEQAEPTSFKSKPWSKAEQNLLKKKVYSAGQIQLVADIQNRYASLSSPGCLRVFNACFLVCVCVFPLFVSA